MRPKFELIAVTCVAGYFLYLSGGGLRAGFTHDDLMNIDRAWSAGAPQLVRETALFFRPSTSYRPMGSLFYERLFDTFGLQQGPYRIAILGLLLANLGLAYLAVRYLTGSAELALVAALLHCYHPALSVFYLSTGQIYDILCAFFYFLALTIYFRIRSQGRLPSRPELVLLLSLLVLALNAKEMAVTLPVAMGLYELVFFRPGSWRWLVREGRTALAGGLAVAAFVYGRVYSTRDALPSMEAYAPSPSLALWASNWSFWLDRLRLRFNETPSMEWIPAVVCILAAVAVAGKWRRHLAYGLMLAVAGALPVSFISRRDLTAVDIPLLGLALSAAVLVVVVTGRLPGRPWAAAGLCAIALFTAYRPFSRHDRGRGNPEADVIRTAMEQYQHSLPRLQPGSRVLILNDPFEGHPYTQWASVFLLRLINREPDLIVHRLARLRRPPAPDELAAYDHVIRFEDRELHVVPYDCRQTRLREAQACPRPKAPGWVEGWDD